MGTEGQISTTNAEGLDEYEKQDWRQCEKQWRDMCFPLKIMEKAYNKETQIEITKAQASVQDDFKRIINSINEVPVEMLDTHEPDLSHKNCKEVNRALRSMFAKATLWLAANTGVEALTRAMHAIAKDTTQTKLVMHCKVCDQLSDISCIGEGLQKLTNLQHLQMGFSSYDPSDIRSIGEGLQKLTNLQHLQMEFCGCEELSDISSIGEGLQKLTNLQHLEMNFGECKQIADISCIGEGLQKLTNLQHLQMDFSSEGPRYGLLKQISDV